MTLPALFSMTLFATGIIAAPRSHGLASRAKLRATRTHSGAPLYLKHSKDILDDKDVIQIDYSFNWAGTVLAAPPAGQTFNTVSGQFLVPTTSYPSGASANSGSYAASIWVSIDGDNYQNAALQVGDATINSDGSYSYSSWYEWYPNYSMDFDPSAFSFSEGDNISIPITSSSFRIGDSYSL